MNAIIHHQMAVLAIAGKLPNIDVNMDVAILTREWSDPTCRNLP
jgi:hypothetical protein